MKKERKHYTPKEKVRNFWKSLIEGQLSPFEAVRGASRLLPFDVVARTSDS
jgi:hypothetical protein